MELSGKRALITGGTRGIGAGIAYDLARRGARIAINSRAEDEAAQATLKGLAACGTDAHFIQADMAKPDDIARLVEQSVAAMGGLDIIVHNAGGPSGGKIEDVTPEQWMQTFDVHVHAAYHLCRTSLPHLRKNQEGVILLVSSAGGIRGCPGAICYGTAKAAILQFTRMLARDVADDNIRVNCVVPGIIRTRFHDAMTQEQQAHNLANRIPLHREGSVDDVAQAANLLITNQFMTGEAIVVDGGMSMQMVR